jgi:transcriptional regulator of acetoin/glycerol metabolism
VRELKNVVERTVLLTSGNAIETENFSQAIKSDRYAEPVLTEHNSHFGTLDDMERTMIIRTIEECGGNLSKSSHRLGISRATLYRKMERHGIQTEKNE